MTIPTLIHSYQKRVMESVLKEDYSTLQQVMRLNIYDDLALDPNIPDNLAGVKDWFFTYLAPHLKYEQVCFETKGCWHDKRHTRNLLGNKASGSRIGLGLGGGIMTVRLPNGSNLCIDGFRPEHLKKIFGVDLNDSGVVVYADVNGDRNPNVIGKDIFVFVFTDQGLVPAGYSETPAEYHKNCSKNAKGANAGYFCGMRIKESGWIIPDDLWRIKQ